MRKRVALGSNLVLYVMELELELRSSNTSNIEISFHTALVLGNLRPAIN